MIHFSSTVSDLGFLIDGRLNMADHVASVCRLCFHQLRQLRQVRGSLTTAALKTLVHAFISSRLDYCNSLLSGITDSLLDKLQSVQNAAARLITGTCKFDHITPVLSELHWLPVRQRITFKVALLVYKCLHGLANWQFESPGSLTWPSFVNQWPVYRVGNTYDPLPPACCLFRELELCLAAVTSPFTDRPRGTVFRVIYGLSNCQLALS